MRQKLEKGQSYFDIISSSDKAYLTMKKIIISDCDGVITDGNSIYTNDGKIAKVYGAYDTEMISFMKTQGWEFRFVSTDSKGYSITKKRIVDDGNCKLFYYNAEERYDLVNNYINNGYIVLFVGDSLSDIKAMSAATYAACPYNAVKYVKPYTDYVSENVGGHGALGDILMWVHKTLCDQQTKNNS